MDKSFSRNGHVFSADEGTTIVLLGRRAAALF